MLGYGTPARRQVGECRAAPTASGSPARWLRARVGGATRRRRAGRSRQGGRSSARVESPCPSLPRGGPIIAHSPRDCLSLSGMEFGLFFLMQRDEQWSERAVVRLERSSRCWPPRRSAIPRSGSPSTTSTTTASCPVPPVLAAFLAARTAHAAARHGREPAAAAPPGGPGRAARGAGRGERGPARRGHRPRRHAAGLPDLPVRPRRQPRSRRGRHRADAAVLERRARSISGPLPLGRAASRAPAPRAATASAALHRRQQRGQRALGRAASDCPRSPRSSCRWTSCGDATTSIREALPPRAARRREIEALERRSWGCGWCTSRPTAARPCEAAEPPSWAISARWRSCARTPPAAPSPTPSTARSCACAPSRAIWTTAGPRRHAGRGAGRAAGLSPRQRLPAGAAADGAAGTRHPARASLHAALRLRRGPGARARSPARVAMRNGKRAKPTTTKLEPELAAARRSLRNEASKRRDLRSTWRGAWSGRKRPARSFA